MNASALFGFDFAACGPELIAALVAAQEAAHYVAKDGKNQGRPYATGEAMIAEGKDALNPRGLCLVTSPCSIERVDLPEGAGSKDGPGQWTCGTMTIAWALLHTSGQRLSGYAAIDVVEGRGTPADKASRAADTYALGFIYRDLLQLNRGQAPVEDDVDARPDHDRETAPRGRPSPRQSQQPNALEQARLEARRDAGRAWDDYSAAHLRATTKPADQDEVMRDFQSGAGLNAWPETPSADLYAHLAKWLRQAATELDRVTKEKAGGYLPGVDLPPGENPDATPPKNGAKGRERRA